MAEIDPWERAQACEQALQRAANDIERHALKSLRDLWIAFGNESQFWNMEQIAAQVAKIDHIHFGLVAAETRAVN